jgi:predicted Zn-dependent protease
VIQKLVKEVGLAVLVSMTTGGNETVIVKEILKTLSSSAFDRSLEKEADIKAVEYLINAKIDPEPFANFLYKIANNDSDFNQYFSWINTHPDSKERAEYIVKHNTDKVLETEPVLSQQTWDLLKENLRN